MISIDTREYQLIVSWLGTIRIREGSRKTDGISPFSTPVRNFYQLCDLLHFQELHIYEEHASKLSKLLCALVFEESYVDLSFRTARFLLALGFYLLAILDDAISSRLVIE